MTRMIASTSAPSLRAAIDPRLVLSLAAVYLIWSSTYLAMKIAILNQKGGVGKTTVAAAVAVAEWLDCVRDFGGGAGALARAAI